MSQYIIQYDLDGDEPILNESPAEVEFDDWGKARNCYHNLQRLLKRRVNLDGAARRVRLLMLVESFAAEPMDADDVVEHPERFETY